jgi:hypothetical protein
MMKKSKSKSSTNKARKAIKKEINQKLITGLKVITHDLVLPSKKLDKILLKEAKVLARKISRKLVIDESWLENNSEEQSAPVVEAS